MRRLAVVFAIVVLLEHKGREVKWWPGGGSSGGKDVDVNAVEESDPSKRSVSCKCAKNGPAHLGLKGFAQMHSVASVFPSLLRRVGQGDAATRASAAMEPDGNNGSCVRVWGRRRGVSEEGWV